MHNDKFSRDDLAAWACIRLDRLAHGYRLLHLFDAKGVHTKGAILLKIDFNFNIKSSMPTREAISDTTLAAHSRADEGGTKQKLVGMLGKAKERAKEEYHRHSSRSEQATALPHQSKLSFRQHQK